MQLFFLLSILCLLAGISYLDIRFMRIPLPLNLGFFALSLAYSYMSGFGLPALFYAFAGFLFIVVIRRLTANGIGLADAILSGSVALLLGPMKWMLCLLSASVLGLILFILLGKKIGASGEKPRLPFAPCIAIATIPFLFIN
jgi:prepilin signal peptidase PulO-like enzyme (type II secretory pathway)